MSPAFLLACGILRPVRMETVENSEDTSTRSRGYVAEAAIVLLAAAAGLRMSGLFRTPLWLDEAYSAFAVEKGFLFTWTVVPTYDTHPPLYYTILGVWSLVAGDSLVALRMLGVVCGLAAIAVTALAGREIARTLDLDVRLVALSAATFVTFSPLMVDMSRQVRPYPVMILAYAAALAAMFRVARLAAESGTVARWPFVGYLVALELTFWLHNVGPLFGASLTIAFIVLVAARVTERSERMLILAGHVVVAVLYVPGLMVLLDQAPTWVHSTWLAFRWEGLHWKLAALWGGVGIVAIIAAAILALSGIARMTSRPGARVVAALLITAVLPPALSIVLSATLTPIFLIRTLTPVAIPALLLIAVGAGGQKGRWRWAAAVFTLVLVSQMVIVDMNARRAGPREDWYGAVRWLGERFRPGDAVYAYPNEGILPFDRAAGDLGVDFPSRAIPSEVPATDIGWHPTGNRGTVSLPRELLRAIAEEPVTKSVGTVWLLRLGPWSYDKGDVFVEELARDREIVDRWQNGAIDIIGLRRTP